MKKVELDCGNYLFLLVEVENLDEIDNDLVEKIKHGEDGEIIKYKLSDVRFVARTDGKYYLVLRYEECG